MMDLQTISEEISRLEKQKPSYATCEKLADLYIVRDHLMQKQGGSYENYANYGRDRENYARGGSGNYMYDDYNYNYKMMEGGMEMDRSPRMSTPSMR